MALKTDYFTLARYRAAHATPVHSDDEINEAQDEVIDLLERWARTSWATVDPNASSTDGKSTAYRVFTETFRGAIGTSLAGVRTFPGPDLIPATEQIIPLARYPAVSIDSFTVYGTVVDPSAYTLDGPSGRIILQAPIPFDASPAVVTYRYGFGETPSAIRRYAIMAVASMLKDEKTPTKVPRNTERLTSGRTTLVLKPEDIANEPWPWDLRATELITSYWARSRSRLVGVW